MRRWRPWRSLVLVTLAAVLVTQACAGGDAAPPPVADEHEEVDEAPEAVDDAAVDDVDAILAAAIAVAEAFMDVYNTYDAERARELLAADAQIFSPAFRDLADLPAVEKLGAVVELNSLLAFQFSPSSCEVQAPPLDLEPDTPLTVRCRYVLHSRLQEIVDYPPIEGGAFSFVIADGVITRLSESFPFLEWGPNVDAPFIEWLNAEHPDGFDAIYLGTEQERYPRLSREALDLASTYLTEYEEWMNRQGG